MAIFSRGIFQQSVRQYDVALLAVLACSVRGKTNSVLQSAYTTIYEHTLILQLSFYLDLFHFTRFISLRIQRQIKFCCSFVKVHLSI